MMFRKISICTVLVAALVGCGGGAASDVDEIITPPTLNLQEAWRNFNLSNRSYNFTISGVVDGSTLSGSGTMIVGNVSPVVAKSVSTSNPYYPFPGPEVDLSDASKTTITTNLNLTIDGALNIQTSSEDYYFDKSNNLKMIEDLDEKEQSIITIFSPLPAKATSGDSGIVYRATVYQTYGLVGWAQCGTDTLSYSVSSDSSNSLLVTFTRGYGACDAVTKAVYTSQDVYKLTSTDLTPKTFTGSSSDKSGSIILNFR
jgi:hypothetical protein